MCSKQFSTSIYNCFVCANAVCKTVFTQNDGVMLLVHLEPARLGTLSYYLPILLLDDPFEGEMEVVVEAGAAGAAQQD